MHISHPQAPQDLPNLPHETFLQEVLSLKAYVEGRGHLFAHAEPAQKKFRCFLLFFSYLLSVGLLLYAGFAKDDLPMLQSPVFYHLLGGLSLWVFGLLQLLLGFLRGISLTAALLALIPIGDKLVKWLISLSFISPSLSISVSFSLLLILALAIYLAQWLFRLSHFDQVLYYTKDGYPMGSILTQKTLTLVSRSGCTMELSFPLPRWLKEEENAMELFHHFLFHVQQHGKKYGLILMGFRQDEKSVYFCFASQNMPTQETARAFLKSLSGFLSQLHFHNGEAHFQAQSALAYLLLTLYPTMEALSQAYNELIDKILENRRMPDIEYEAVYELSFSTKKDVDAFQLRCKHNKWEMEHSDPVQVELKEEDENLPLSYYVRISFPTRLGKTRIHLNSSLVLEETELCHGEMLGWHLKEDEKRVKKSA